MVSYLKEVIAVPLLDKPLLPGFYIKIKVKDPKLVKALQESIKQNAVWVGAFLLKDSSLSSETENHVLEKLKGEELINQMHRVGTLASISSLQGDQLLLVGGKRLRMTGMGKDPLTVKVVSVEDKPFDKDDGVIKATHSELMSKVRDVFKTESLLLWKDQVQRYTRNIGDFDYANLADFGAGISGANKHENQGVLEEVDVHKRLELTLELVKKSVEVIEIKTSVAKTVEEKLNVDVERRFVLLEKQLKDITAEKVAQNFNTEAEQNSEKFKKRIESSKEKIPEYVLKVMEQALEKLKVHPSWSSDFADTIIYLDWLTMLPWGNLSDENFDILRAEKILDEDHFGLLDVKERILEFIAVKKLTSTSQGKIICLSGPPGVGKTSIGQSIARALNRKFYRIAVGGLSEISEIKGHSQSYKAALPGKMVHCLKSVGTENPLVLIDEIDKIGKDAPFNALLEVLDPEQNAKFLDYYLDVPIDLSKVLFVCTANDVDKIPKPLLDRMEVIKLTGYTTDEKMHIARNYFLKKTCRDCGINPEQVDVSDAALLSLIENYCREAGVRSLQKHIEKIYRKIALKVVREEAASVFEEVWTIPKTKKNRKKKQSEVVTKTVTKFMIDESNLAEYVGKPVFDAEKIYERTPVGVAMGLAWTSTGGATTYIETALVEEREGKGCLDLTGQLGSAMQESARIAHTVARKVMLMKEPESKFFTNSKLHLHVPDEATPKDGPSAGCTMITSLLSLAMKKPVRKDLAMTGEVTLTGKILPIGGVKEKIMGARWSQVKIVILPEANRTDFDELPKDLKEGLDVRFVHYYEQIFNLAFGNDQ